MKPLIALLLLASCAVLSSCETFEKLAPHTAAGFQSNGIIGALDGASDAVLATCKTLDGQNFRVAVDGLAGETGTASLAERVRRAREKACRIAGSVQAIAAD